MKKTNKMIPLLFMAAGILLIFSVSGYSIKKYVNSSKNNADASVGSLNSSTGEEMKIFFNKPSITPKDTSIKIYKSKRILELYGDGKLLGRFKIGLGRAPTGSKVKEGDNKTPEGSYYICTKNNNSKYYLFMGISYPNEVDAKRGLEEGLIDKATYESIVKAVKNKQQPPWNTALGGAVGIHGGGNKYDWTYGCIAMESNDIKTIKQYTPINTTVEIYK